MVFPEIITFIKRHVFVRYFRRWKMTETTATTRLGSSFCRRWRNTKRVVSLACSASNRCLCSTVTRWSTERSSWAPNNTPRTALRWEHFWTCVFFISFVNLVKRKIYLFQHIFTTSRIGRARRKHSISDCRLYGMSRGCLSGSYHPLQVNGFLFILLLKSISCQLF